MKKLLELYIAFIKIGALTFGGGYAMLPVIQREVVENKQWVTDEEVIEYYAIGQCTPGIIAVNTSTFVGNKVAGIPGGIIATLGFISPASTFGNTFLTISDNIYAFILTSILLLTQHIFILQAPVSGETRSAIFTLRMSLVYSYIIQAHNHNSMGFPSRLLPFFRSLSSYSGICHIPRLFLFLFRIAMRCFHGHIFGL